MKKAVALALVTASALACAAGCSGAPHRTARTTPVAAESSPPPEPVSPQSAAKAFRVFLSNYDVALAAGDERLALWWTSEGQSQLTAAAFRRAAAGGEPVPRYRYESPRFYVPRLRATDVQWFVVSARRTTADGEHPRTVLMGFVRSKPTQHWRLSLAALLDKKQKAPKILVQPDGYAKALPTFDSSLVIPPRLVPSIQATLAEEGPHNVASQVMASGPYTTAYYAADQKVTKPKKPGGTRTSVVYAATNFPIFPLATADGGGIVLYALTRDTAVTKSKKKPGRVPIPKDAAPFIDADLVHSALGFSQTMQYAAVVPPKPKKGAAAAKAEIVGADGGVVKAWVPNNR